MNADININQSAFSKLNTSNKPQVDHKQYNNKKFVWALCFITLASSTGLIGLGHHTYSMYLIVICVIILSIFSPVYSAVTLICYFPVDQLLTGLMPGSTTPGRYLIIYNIIVAAFAFSTSRNLISTHIKNQLYIYCLLLSLAAITLMWAENTQRGVIYLGKLITLFIWSALTIPLLSDKKVLLRLCEGLLITTTISALIFIFGNIGRININDRVMLEGLGINSIAASFGFTISVSVFYIKYAPSKLQKIFSVICCIIIYLSILKMGTRSVGLGIPLAIFAAGLLMNLKNSPKFILVALLAILLFIVAFNIAVSSQLITNKLADRFLGLNQVDTYTDNSRVNLAKWSLTYVLGKNPIGTGAGNENQVFADFEYKVDLYESHNTLLSTMTQFGILGFIILCCALGHLFYTIIMIDSTSYRYLIAIVFIFISFQLLKQSLLQTRLYWIPFTIIFSFINYYYISKENKGIRDYNAVNRNINSFKFNFVK